MNNARQKHKPTSHPVNQFTSLLIRAYQLCISPFKPPTCRYHPTCSHYAREVLQTQPIRPALKLILKRLMSCHPWGGYGYDPPPKSPKPNEPK